MNENSQAGVCQHPAHGLEADEVMLLRTAVTTVQGALWGQHPPTVFGNRPVQLAIAEKLADRLAGDDQDYTGLTVHHAKDGCFHYHFQPRAFLWADHLSACPMKEI